MKKKIAVISAIIVLLLVLFFPVKAHLDDGGSVIYQSIVGVYEIKIIKTYGNEGMTITMKEGLSVKIFGKEIYYKIDKEYPIEQVKQPLDVRDVLNLREAYIGEEHWRMYLSTPYSSMALPDGKGTVELLLDKTLEAYPIDMAADDILASVKEENYVVFEDLCLTGGGEVWKAFYDKVQKKENAQVKLVQYYTLGDEEHYAPEYYEQIKEEYPKLFFISLVYIVGEGFYVNDRLYTREKPEVETQYYKYLKHFAGDSSKKSTSYSRYDRYVLVDDNAATWEEMERQVFSSAFIEDAISWREVYCNIIE